MPAKKQPAAKKQPKFREHVKSMNITPFNYHLTIVVTTDVPQSAAKRGLDDLPPAMYALHAHNGGPASMIILPMTCGVNTIAHEVSHVVWNVMKSIGAEFENEIVAYLHGYICGEVATFMEKYRPGGWRQIGTKA